MTKPATIGVDETVHRRFARLAHAMPDRLAVVDGENRATYGEVLLMADRLAAILEREVAPGSVIALRVGRRLELPACMLGVWQAGCTYMPIDPAMPPARIRYLLSDSGAGLVVTDGPLREGEEVPCGSVPPLTVARLTTEPAPVPLPGSAAAYVLYTSGSTGHPKGCVIGHSQILRLFTAAAPAFRFGADDTWALFHAFTFDPSVLEMWAALLHGGRLVIVPYEAALDPGVLIDLLNRQRVTGLVQVPSSFSRLVHLAAARRVQLPHLRQLILGGEAIVGRDIETWLGRVAPQAAVANVYGPTETTIFVTARHLTAGDFPLSGEGTPIGRPLPHVRVTLRDGAGNVVPAGAPGEIWVAGDALAHGYLNRPELNAERFVFRDGERHYRTGDWALRDAVGELHFLGRRDNQVKLRGHRVELGEIEAAIRGVPGVHAAACKVEDGPKGGQQLVAYVVAVPGGDERPDVRAAIAESLPRYMIPQRVRWIAALPVGSTGKLERAALASLPTVA